MVQRGSKYFCKYVVIYCSLFCIVNRILSHYYINSNIKNTAGPIQMWNEAKQIWETVGQKMGMLVGDYSRFAIQSSINTGSYIGVSANIFGNGLLPKHIPNFTWGVIPGYQLDKAIEDIHNWKKMKGFSISEAEKQVLKQLYQLNHH